MNKEKKAQPNRKPFFRFVKGIMKLFRRKPKIRYLGEKPQGACIYISNHSAASGPVTYELFFPENMRMWGTHEMCFGPKERREYLRNTYFHEKKKLSKTTSRFVTNFASPATAMFYKGMGILPTYSDLRLRKTIDESVELLRDGTNIIIFPEDSSDGYHEVLTKFYGGFMLLAKRYHDTTGEDIKIVNMYLHRRSNQIVIGEPKSYVDISSRMTRKEATEFFLNDTNAIFENHIKPTLKNKKEKKKKE